MVDTPYYYDMETYSPRYYQRIAINRTVEAVAKGAAALLPIRTLYKSGRLDEFHNWRVRDLEQVAFRAA